MNLVVSYIGMMVLSMKITYNEQCFDRDDLVIIEASGLKFTITTGTGSQSWNLARPNPEGYPQPSPGLFVKALRGEDVSAEFRALYKSNVMDNEGYEIDGLAVNRKVTYFESSGFKDSLVNRDGTTHDKTEETRQWWRGNLEKGILICVGGEGPTMFFLPRAMAAELADHIQKELKSRFDRQYLRTTRHWTERNLGRLQRYEADYYSITLH